MAKIYFKKYKKRIDAGEITVEEAKRLASEEVPARWVDEVIQMLDEIN